MEIVSDYIDFSSNAELWKEASCMDGLGHCIFKDGLRQGRKDGLKQGREEGRRALVMNNLETDVPREKIAARGIRADGKRAGSVLWDVRKWGIAGSGAVYSLPHASMAETRKNKREILV